MPDYKGSCFVIMSFAKDTPRLKQYTPLTTFANMPSTLHERLRESIK